MENYPNMMEGSPSSNDQNFYTCRLCFKQGMYHDELILHQQLHLEQMQLGGSLQGSLRPSYYNRPPVYNPGSMQAGSLDSFDNLVQTYRTSVSEAQVRSYTDPRSVMPPSPVSQSDMRHHVPSSPASQHDMRNILPPSPASSLPDQRNLLASSPATQLDPRGGMSSSPAGLIEKAIAQAYRGDTDTLGLVESRTISVDSRNPAVCMHSIPSMPIDTRLMSLDNHGIHSLSGDTRSLSVDSHHMAYSSASYLDSLSRGLYSQDLSSKPLTSVANTYTSQPLGRPGEYLGHEERQMFSKPDNYYGLSKTNYPIAPIPEKPIDSYTTNQYGLSKLLSTQQSRYYQQALPGQSLSHYEMDKYTATPLNYYNQNSVTEVAARASPRIISPKQTLHYGPPPSHSVSLTNHSQFQSSIPKSEVHFSNPVTSNVSQKANDTGQLDRLYPSDNVSSHLTYTHFYKGSHPQSQVYSSVQSHHIPLQHDYKLSTEQIPMVNLESKPLQTGPVEFSCYICSLPFADMCDLSEHMKLHAQGMVDQNRVPVKSHSNLNLENTGKTVYPKVSPPVVNMPVTSPGMLSTSLASQQISPAEEKNKGNFKCFVCDAAFSENEFLAEHMFLHSDISEKFECRICKKVFKNKTKCMRHEALHQRNVLLFYCEFCEEEFKYKGSYLNHMQKKHGENGDIVKRKEQTIGTKKAIPLTAGSIDKKFEMLDIDMYVDCQVCDKEILREKLIEHLKTHTIHACNKCDSVFVQKTEYVEHLMQQHGRELDDSSDNRSIMDNSDHENEADVSSNDNSGLENTSTNVAEEIVRTLQNEEEQAKKLNRNRKDVIKDLKEKKKEVMKNLKEKQKEIEDLEKQNKIKEKAKDKPLKDNRTKHAVAKNANEENKSGNDKISEMEKIESKLKFSCCKCDRLFTKEADLSVHIEAHVKDPSRIYCEVCEISYHYKDKGYYIYHMKYHKDSEITNLNHPDKLPCNVCYTLIPKEVYITHVKREHSLFSCEICQWSYSGENALVKHMRSIHGGKKYKYYVYVKQSEDVVPVEEKPAPVVYKKLKDIKAEQNNAEDKIIRKHVCKVCKKAFGTKQNFDRHMKVHNLPIEDVHIKCELCAAAFSSRGAYLYHIVYHRDMNPGDELVAGKGKIITNVDALNNDKIKPLNDMEVKKNDTNDGLVSKAKGSIVKSETASKSSVKKEVITVLNHETGDFEEQEIETQDESEIITLHLFETDNNNEIVKRENAANMNKVEQTDSLKPTSEVVNEIIYCKLCNKSLTMSNLSEHVRSHPVFSCNACEYSFTKKNRYVDHQRTLHLDEYIVQEVSKVKLIEKAQVDKLSKGEEKDKRECETSKRKKMYRFLSCPLCTGEFKHDRYVDHIKSHAKLKMNCQFCGEVFSKKNVLLMHENSHERITYSDTELPYPKICPFCDESLFTRDGFVSHTSEHTKRGPFKCKKCEFVFTSEKNLDSHVKVKHDRWCKVFWKQDFEGLRFDTRSGRVSEVFSDTLNEIREINELMKHNKKTTIWCTSTPKKVKDSEKKNNVASQKNTEVSEFEKTENESNNENDKGIVNVKLLDDDLDYVPKARSSRKRSGHNMLNADKDNNEDCSLRKRKRKLSEIDSNDDSLSEEEYAPKPTRTRSTVNKKNFMLKSTVEISSNKPVRVLRSFENKVSLSEKVPSRTENVKVNAENVKDKEVINRSKNASCKESDTSKQEPRRTRSQTFDKSFPEKCPQCGIVDFSFISYDEHMQVHASEKKLRCPRCDQTFSRTVNLNMHIMYKHKDYKLRCQKKREREVTKSTAIVGRLRTRNGNLQKDSGQPISTSTPIRGSKLVVRLSPLDLEENSRKMDTSSTSKNEDKLLNESKKGHNIALSLKRSRKGDKLLNDIAKRDTSSNGSRRAKTMNDSIKNDKLLHNSTNVEKSLNDNLKQDKILHNSKKEKSLNKNNGKGQTYTCPICNRNVHRKWNMDQHMKTHEKDSNCKPVEDKPVPMKKELRSREKDIKATASKKDVKRKDKESKPFSCKDCSESFKKKRDLYIHTKVHTEDPDEISAMDLSMISKQDSCLTNNNSSCLNIVVNEYSSQNNATENEVNERDLAGETMFSESDNPSNIASSVTGLPGVEKCIDLIDEKSKAIRKGKRNVSGSVSEDLGEIQQKKRKSDVSKKGHNVGKDNNIVSEPDNSGEQKCVVQGKNVDTVMSAQSKNEIDKHAAVTGTGNEVIHNHNEENPNNDDSEIDDKNKPCKVQTSVTKMSAENALSKWKVKVNGTLLSQLELNAAKKLEELANPGSAKIKDQQSVTGKPDKRNFECRICGDNFCEEMAFRQHMDGHMIESPPYCSICDIYFMAIYPKKRLIEHNRKKHPELKC